MAFFACKSEIACKSKIHFPCKKNRACKTYRVNLGACKKNRQISVKKIGLAITFSIGLGLLREGELDCVGSGFGFTRVSDFFYTRLDLHDVFYTGICPRKFLHGSQKFRSCKTFLCV